MQKLCCVKLTYRNTLPQLDLTYMSIFHHRTQQCIFRKDTQNFTGPFIYAPNSQEKGFQKTQNSTFQEVNTYFTTINVSCSDGRKF